MAALALAFSSRWPDGDLKASSLTLTKGTRWASILSLAFGSLGVIFGDIGTSPLYVYATVFANHTPDKDDVLGAVSLIFWSLTFIVLIKYVGIVQYADDDGEGGTFALYSMLCRRLGISPHGVLYSGESAALQKLGSSSRNLLASQSGSGGAAAPRAWWRRLSLNGAVVSAYVRRSRASQLALWGLAIAGTALVLGDGVLTPAISVLSAVSGLSEASDSISDSVVVGVAIAILVILFSVQCLGTHRISFTFAPIVALWLLSNAGVAIYNFTRYGGEVFAGLSPHYIVVFFQRSGREGWLMLAGVMLCVTGAEALFADLGHFTRRSIMLAFGAVAYPCLVITYMGQGAYLLNNPSDVGSTFWKCCPKAYFYPMLILATLASVVASQALITASFSLIANAIRLGCFPKLQIHHTSAYVHGQIYIAEVNTVLMLLCVAVVAGFRDTVALGNAYGLTISSVFIITTLLMLLTMVAVWEVSFPLVVVFGGVFLLIEGAFLSANLWKVPQGGWFTLVIAAGAVYVMLTWWAGSRRCTRVLLERTPQRLTDLFFTAQQPTAAAASTGSLTPSATTAQPPPLREGRASSSTASSLRAAPSPALPQLQPAAAAAAGEIAAASSSTSTSGAARASAPAPSAAALWTPPLLQQQHHSRGPQLLVRLGDRGRMAPLARQPGIGIYYSDTPVGLPYVLMHFLRKVQAIHDVTVFMSVRRVPIPRVLPEERLLVRALHPAPHFYQVVARYGYLDHVDHGPAFVTRVVSAIVHLLRTSRGPATARPAAFPTPASAPNNAHDADEEFVAAGDAEEQREVAEPAAVKLAVAAPAVQQAQVPADAVTVADQGSSGGAAAVAALGGGGASAQGSRSSAPPVQAVDEEAVVRILEALRNGVLHYIGLVHVRPDPYGSFMNQLLYGSVYRGLLALSYSDVEHWKLPRDNVIELGMPVYI